MGWTYVCRAVFGCAYLWVLVLCLDLVTDVLTCGLDVWLLLVFFDCCGFCFGLLGCCLIVLFLWFMFAFCIVFGDWIWLRIVACCLCFIVGCLMRLVRYFLVGV